MQKKTIWIFFALIATAGMSVFAQDARSNLGDAGLPDEVARQVVSGILRYYFKPEAKRRTVRLASSRVKREWLPDIRNVRFELVPDEEIDGYYGGVVLFEPVEREGDAYTIGFGRGAPRMGARGDTWEFRIVAGRARLGRQKGIGWGRGGLSHP